MLDLVIGLLSGAASAFGAVKLGDGRRAEVLRHPIRQAIVEHLRVNKCASISDLCRSLDLSWGVMQHHLYVLKRAGVIFGARQGRSHIFFPREEREARAEILALLQSPRAREIVTQVSTEPGVRQKELCERLGLSRKVFRHHINLLSQAGLIIETKRESSRVYAPTDLVRAEFPVGPANVATADQAAPAAPPPPGPDLT